MRDAPVAGCGVGEPGEKPTGAHEMRGRSGGSRKALDQAPKVLYVRRMLSRVVELDEIRQRTQLQHGRPLRGREPSARLELLSDRRRLGAERPEDGGPHAERLGREEVLAARFGALEGLVDVLRAWSRAPMFRRISARWVLMQGTNARAPSACQWITAWAAVSTAPAPGLAPFISRLRTGLVPWCPRSLAHRGSCW